MTPTLCEYDTHFVVWGHGLLGSTEFKKSDGWTRPLLQNLMVTLSPSTESIDEYDRGYAQAIEDCENAIGNL